MLVVDVTKIESIETAKYQINNVFKKVFQELMQKYHFTLINMLANNVAMERTPEAKRNTIKECKNKI